MIARTIFGWILLVLGIGCSIYLGEWVINDGFRTSNYEDALGPFLLGPPALIVCCSVAAIGWWLVYPKGKMSAREAFGWFVIACLVWLFIFFSVSLVTVSWVTEWKIYHIPILLFLGLAILGSWWWLIRPKYSEARMPYVRVAKQTPRNGLALFAMILGICGIVLVIPMQFYGVPAVLAVIGIVFGVLALYRVKKEPSIGGQWSAIAGLACGIIALAAYVALTVLRYTG